MFGQLADKYGRTKMFMVTMGIIALFSAASASSPKFGKTGNGLFVWLAVMRFFLGLGNFYSLLVSSYCYSKSHFSYFRNWRRISSVCDDYCSELDKRNVRTKHGYRNLLTRLWQPCRCCFLRRLDLRRGIPLC